MDFENMLKLALKVIQIADYGSRVITRHRKNK
jgi:hypothetical protein